MSVQCIKHPEYPKKILLSNHQGVIKLNQILASWKLMIARNMVTQSTQGIMCDLNDANLDITMSDFKFAIHSLEKFQWVKQIKIAVITNSPHDVVFPMFGEKYHPTIKIRPFSTFKGAEDWILL
tara:strand:- start:41087 stop:41458 length:372 start_codon:yes stop_codon:yes gene_type:complete